MRKYANDMTVEELRKLADQKEQEEENKIHKQGFLKEDLYDQFSDRHTYCFDDLVDDWVYTKKEVDEIKQNFADSFTLILKKGAKFVAFKNDDDTYSWYDDENYGIENRDDAWAKRFLENITEV